MHEMCRSISGSYMGMLTGIRVLTLVELAFWFVRLFSRRCFRSSKTGIEQAESPPNKKIDRIDALEKQNAAMEDKITMIEKNMSLKSKSRGQKAKIYNWSTMTRR